MKCKQVYLKYKKDDALRRRHPWIFSGAIDYIDTDVVDGDEVEVVSDAGEFLAKGHYQTGGIAVRVLSFERERFDIDFWKKRIQNAYVMRQSLFSVQATIYRLVNAEGDGLSGLVVDIYADTAVIQSFSLGIHLSRKMIAEALQEVLGQSLHNIYYKPDPSLSNHMEGHFGSECLLGVDNSVILAQEGGISFSIDWLKGQKTGFFIDQHDNRKLFKMYANGKSVLDLFCYSGAFSLSAISGSAKSVHSVDSSSRAISQLARNVELNNFSTDRKAFIDDSFKFLESVDFGEYNLISIDPPPFAKNKAVLKNALQGYKRLNTLAIEKIAEGGIIFTFSSSQMLSKEMFRSVVFSAAAYSGRRVRILHQLSQSADHPINIYHPEGESLKGLVLFVE